MYNGLVINIFIVCKTPKEASFSDWEVVLFEYVWDSLRFLIITGPFRCVTQYLFGENNRVRILI